MSEIKVNKVTPRVACGTTQLGDSGDTITIPSGATIQNLGTATGFGGTGVVSWDTASIKTTGFTAVTGTGYFCNTTGGPFTVTLPLSPSAGDVVGVSDYAQTFDTDTLTLGRNSSNIAGIASDSFISTAGIAVTLVYVDVTKGWIVTDSGLQSDAPGPLYIAATGGDAIVTCGNFKTHIFTNPGSFCVSILANPAGGPNNVDYLVVAGGGSGGSSLPAGSGMGVGGGGAGGFRLSNSVGCLPAPSMSPLATPAGVPVSIQPYSIVIGGGATAAPASNSNGNDGTDTTALGITSTAGGGGGSHSPAGPGNPGGSGGGSGYNIAGGTGNTPPVSPPQGNPGGALTSTGPQYSATGGGGAGATGQTNPAGNIGGAGGIGSYIADGFVGPTPAPTYGSPGPVSNSRYFAGGGGGGGGIDCGPPGTGGAGGSGGGAAGGNSGSGAPASQGGTGTINTGGGGGGAGGSPNPTGTGGSGIVMIRYKYQ